jgi:CubicO group peptidase (beta-lactamase class C family)
MRSSATRLYEREFAARNRIRLVAICLTIALGLLPMLAHAESNLGILHRWLKAFNDGNFSALTDFQQRYAGNAEIREETGGFDLVKIQLDTPTQLSALLRQRNFPSQWQLTMKRQASNSLAFQFRYSPVPVAQPKALSALNAFAGRLAVADKFSGIIAVAQHGKEVFAKTWGLADRGEKTPVTMSTQFLFASQGKMFTAVAVLQLVERGKLNLDDTVGQYLTDYPNAEVARKVTIRELLNHTSGVGDIELLQPKFAANRAAVHSIAAIIKLNGDRPPAFEAGSQFKYSNYGYVLLGAILAKVSGQNYYDYLRTHIFEPAGMTRSGYPMRELMAGMAIPYSNFDDNLKFDNRPTYDVSDELPWRGTPAGGGVSTAADMIRFVAALNSGKLLSRAMLDAATRPETDPDSGFGFGFITSKVANFPYWGHGGGAPGQSLVLDYYPLTDTTFICMSNRDPPVCDRLAFNFLFRSRTMR